MDANDLRVIITVTLFIAFLGIIFWAYSSRQKDRFDEAANLPFADEDMQMRTIEQSSVMSEERPDIQTSKSRSEEVPHG